MVSSEGLRYGELWSIALPYYEKSKAKSPVEHIEYTCAFAKIIADGEKLNPVDRRILLLAAMFHDIGICKTKTKKIVESDIERSGWDEKLVDRAIHNRLEHMLHGARIANRILTDYSTDNPFHLMHDDVLEIVRLVRNHDNYKIAKLAKDGKWLTGKNDWLLQLLNEADALWMLTKDGIQTDIDRGSGMDKTQQMDWNINQHHKYYDSYVTYGSISGMGFREKTFYRSKTGWLIFLELSGGM